MATRRAPLSYLLLLSRQRVQVRHWAIVVAVAIFAALALLVQPILTAAWTTDAVQFIASATELQQRAQALGHALSNTLDRSPQDSAAVQQWVADSHALLANVPFHDATAAGMPTDAGATQRMLASAALGAAEELRRHLNIDIMVRLALLVVAGGGMLIGFRLRRSMAVGGLASEHVEEKAFGAWPVDRHLDLLDRVMSALSGAAPGQHSLEQVAQAMMDALSARACGICLNDETSEFLQLPPAMHAGTLGWAQLEQARGIAVSGTFEAFELPPPGVLPHAAPSDYGIAVRIGDGREAYGHLFVIFDAMPELPETSARIGEIVGRHLAVAIGHSRRTQEGRRVALLEERTAMARELHDSLAQSLSFTKIQVSRLQTMLERGSDREEVAATAEELRDGLNGAYRKLRELITTFRAQINVGGLAVALDEALEEYGARSSVVMTLDNRLKGCQLSANEEFHIVQIVREALSNIVRHAGATQALVKLAPHAGGTIAVSVEDDGLGIDPAADVRNRHGTTIMRERALSLGGALSIVNRPDGGCCVQVSFKPAASMS